MSLRARLFDLFVPAVVVAPLAACAGSAPPPAVVPQTTLAAVVATPPASEIAADEAEPAPAPAERIKHHVEITVDHLPAPGAFAAGATTYVFWVRGSEEEAWSNAAHLDRSDTAEEAHFPFAEDTLYVHVTAEAAADARRPSERVVLSTRVSRNGACASSVDQNAVTMRVRMCR